MNETVNKPRMIEFIFSLLLLLLIWTYGIRFLHITLIASKYRDHLLVCSQLPKKEEVERVWNEHQENFYKVIGIEKKEGVEVFAGRVKTPYTSNPDITNLKCKDTDDLVFIVEDTKQKEKLEKAFPTTFYGIPYRIKAY